MTRNRGRVHGPIVDPEKTSARFDNRAELYARYRPGYPAEMYEYLLHESALPQDGAIADLGSGTGILAAPLLDRGFCVYGVEPNDDMRAVAESALGRNPNFHSLNATAEATHLDDASVDLVVAGQAFHWFEPEATRAEVRRILRPGGRCALIWNQRQLDTTPFLRAYEAFLLEWGTDYQAVSETYANPDAIALVLGANCLVRRFENVQAFDEEGLLGRLRSSSYTPAADDANFQPMIAALRTLFANHEQRGIVRIEYTTEVYLSAAP